MHSLRQLCQRLPVWSGALEMANYTRAGDLDGAVRFGLMDCISCAYVCPAQIPLVQYCNYAKGELTARQRAEHKQEETRRLAELRSERLERQKQAKRAALSQRKQTVEQPAATAEAAEA